MFIRFVFLAFLLIANYFSSAQGKDTTLIYRFQIREEIAPPIVRTVNKALKEAVSLQADYILVEMNTYGGLVDAADSIRTSILKSSIPVIVLIENNAASAGALISIACDSIYMNNGSTIGAATVVDQSGQQVPDKYQSYMRKKMRATAEVNGRDPDIAEAMVDPDVYIPGVIDSGKVLTFTTTEAIKHGFCDGIAESTEDVLELMGIIEYRIVDYTPTWIDNIIGFLISPMISGILIMLIIGGIYYELQTPGIGFPIAASIVAATLYFAPLYLEGLAQHWEILLFIAGVGLLAVEIFAIPGFGVAGISGVALIMGGLTLSLVGNDGFDFPIGSSLQLLESFLIVIVFSVLSVLLAIVFGARLVNSPIFRKVVLTTELGPGYTNTPEENLSSLAGTRGIAETDLRPSGKVGINGERYEATAISGYIEKGAEIEVVRKEISRLIVRKASDNRS